MVRLALYLLLAASALAAASAAAQHISPADRATIAQRIATFDKMMTQGRTGDSLDFVPPRLLATIAAKGGVSVADVKASFATQVAQAMKDVTFVSFGMDLAAATVATTPDKRRTYLLLPTETVIQVTAGPRLRSNTVTLALKEGALWYLVRIDNPGQVALLRAAYPEFAGVDFPTGSTTPLPPP